MTPQFIFSQKEMCAKLGRSREYVRAMCSRGFVLPATIEEAVVFLRQHPKPCQKMARHGEKRKRLASLGNTSH